MTLDRSKERIKIVDGFRCIAVIAVMLYHYLYRFSPPKMDVNYYPYQYNTSVLEYGFFGVQLFFVISGFVIFQTLEKTPSFKQFLIKRWIRLWPTLVLCSVITYVVVLTLDSENNFPFFHQNNALDLLPSWTFLPPAFWTTILDTTGIAYIDGAYWSLFAEVVFYVFGGVLFFWRPDSFLQNWVKLTLLVSTLRILTSPKIQQFLPERLASVADSYYAVHFSMNFVYWVYFAIGMFFYKLYSKGTVNRSTYMIIGTLVLLEIYFLGDDVLQILFVGLIALFSILIAREKWLAFFSMRYIVWVGSISYPLYLLHENIGLVLINKLDHLFDHNGALLLPFVVSVILLVAAGLIHRYFEIPVASLFKTRLVRTGNQFI